MSHELGPVSRALLDAAREGLTPDAASIARIRTKVDASIARGGGAGGAFATKLGLLTLVVAVVTGSVFYAQRDRHGSPDQLTAIGSSVASALVEEPFDVGSSHHVTTEAAAVLPAPASSPIAPREDAARQPRPITRAVTSSTSGTSGTSGTAGRRADRRGIELGREVELIDRAMAAMRRGDPAAALAAVRVHAGESAGAGQLAEDAAAIELEALCRTHDESFPRKLDVFDVRWPESAQRARISSSCRE